MINQGTFVKQPDPELLEAGVKMRSTFQLSRLITFDGSLGIHCTTKHGYHSTCIDRALCWKATNNSGNRNRK
jgi:hypothetical protein